MLQIQIDHQSPRFAPGDEIKGKVQWSELPANTNKLAVRLLWFTSGKGTRDMNTCQEIVQPLGTAPSTSTFQFIAPHRPLSFAGQLISLQWAIEAVVFPSMQSTLAEIIITHGQAEIILPDASQESKRLGVRKPWFSIGG